MVVHGCYVRGFRTSLRRLLRPVQKFALMLASLSHDLKHPGNTNLFEINSQSKLAIRYSDQSVLE